MNDILAGSGPSPEWGFGLGGSFFLVSVLAVWAGIHLRSRTDDRLHQRVDVAYAGLAERATVVLQRLRDEIGTVLPDETQFDPETAFGDPAAVEQSAKQGVAVLRMRSLIRVRFKHILQICSWLHIGSWVFTGAILVTTTAYFTLFDLKFVWFSAFIFTVAVFFACVAGLFAYSYHESKIQASVEASNDHTEVAS